MTAIGEKSMEGQKRSEVKHKLEALKRISSGIKHWFTDDVGADWCPT